MKKKKKMIPRKWWLPAFLLAHINVKRLTPALGLQYFLQRVNFVFFQRVDELNPPDDIDDPNAYR